MLAHYAGDPRVRRSARVLSAAAIVTLLAMAICPLLSELDKKAFHEISQGFQDLLPSLITPKSESIHNNFALLLAFLLFSAAAVFAGYRISGAGQVAFVVQILVISLIYQSFCWQLFSVAGHPVSIATAILCGAVAGRILKLRDEERRQLESKQMELKLRNEELQESRLALVKQDESERRLLAADLHDQVLNDLRTIQKRFEQYAQDPEDEVKLQINNLLKQSMSQIREIMDELCPVLLEEFGLAAAIEDRLDKASTLAGFEVRFQQSCPNSFIDEVSAVEKQLLYRLVQESLTNVCKHAEATLVRLSIEKDDSDLLIRITDNGKGIDMQSLSKSSRGTVYMRLRAALIGARVSWKQGQDGKGTTVEIRLHVQSSGS